MKKNEIVILICVLMLQFQSVGKTPSINRELERSFHLQQKKDLNNDSYKNLYIQNKLTLDKMAEEIQGEEIGKVFTYFSNVGVAGIQLSGTLKVGDKIRIKGATTDFEQTVDSMQIEREAVEEAKKGSKIGIKVKDRVRDGDKVYKVE